MTRETSGRPPAPGYRGSLPPRSDRLAAPWVLAVVATFVLVMALAYAGVPSRLLATPTGSPSASVFASGSAIPSGVASSGGPSASP